MADISVTAADVNKVSGVDLLVTYGATITVGQLVYQDATDNNDWKLVDAQNAISEDTPVGIALTGGADGQPGIVQTAGVIDMGGVTVIGTIYHSSATAGGVTADAMSSDDYPVIVGIGQTATNIKLSFNVPGIQVP